MKDSIDSIIRRTQRYWYVDGLAEMMVGLFLVVVSAYFLFQARIDTSGLNPILANAGLLAAILVVLWFLRTVLRALKARLTYPRTGYVAHSRMRHGNGWQQYGPIALLAIASLSLLVLTLHWHTVPSWAPFLEGSVAGLTVLAVGMRFQLLRFAWLASLLVLIGAVITFINPGVTLATTLSSTAGGMCFIVSGGITLVHYLRTTRPPSEAGL